MKNHTDNKKICEDLSSTVYYKSVENFYVRIFNNIEALAISAA